MDIITQFTNFLSSEKNPPSRLTIKNYRADVNHFVHWFEKEYAKVFNPHLVSPEIIDIYKKIPSLSPRSMERHISSLKKFFVFLKMQEISSSPFEQKIKNESPDPFRLKDFKNYLYIYNSSPLTIKNYINDVAQFIRWLEQINKINYVWRIQDKSILNHIQATTIEEYKKRLRLAFLSPISINRKISSLRRYTHWANEVGLIKTPLIFTNLETEGQNSQYSPSFTPTVQPFRNYSKFPPLRLMQKLKKGLIFTFDSLLVTPMADVAQKLRFALWNLRGQTVFLQNRKNQLFTRVRNYPKSMYAPLEISTKYFPWHKKILHKLAHNRPKWYINYHSYSFVHYMHGVILLFTIFFTSLWTYHSLFTQPYQNKAVLGVQQELQSTRTIPFEGRLMDTNNLPITNKTLVTFSLYDSPIDINQTHLWQEQQMITPNNNGIFSVLLGKNPPIPNNIFSNNQAIYLGIAIGDDQELRPLYQLPTTAYATTADTLQGLPLITQSGAPTHNAVLALDSSGNLIIGKNTSTTFQATSGKFTLSGETLLLTTNPGSSSDILLSPDGSGKIDIQKPIQNTTNSNNLSGIEGAVEIDDLLAILATSSAQSAFSVNQNGTGQIISASRSGTAKFIIENDGSAYIAGNLGIGTQNPIAKLQIEGSIAPATANQYDLGSPSLRWNTLYINSIEVASPSATFGYWQRKNNTLSPATITDALNLGSADNSLALVHLGAINNEASFIKTGGNVGIGTASPLGMLHVQGNGTTNGVSFLVTDSANTQRLTLLDNGNLGIGDSSPQNALKVVGSICIKAGSGSCLGNAPGTLYASNTTVQAGDVAEMYVSKELLEPGEIVIPEGASSTRHSGLSRIDSGDAYASQNDNNNAVVKSESAYQSQVIGIVSTKPGVTINADAKTDTIHPYLYPIALVGRVPVKVTTENGNIEVGDYLTTSSVPGVAMSACNRSSDGGSASGGKATCKAGVVIGKALEAFEGPNETSVTSGVIMVYATTSWHDPDASFNQIENIQLVYLSNSKDPKTEGLLSPIPTETPYTEPIETTPEKFSLKDSTGRTIKRIGVFSNAVIAQLQTGAIYAQKLNTQIITATAAQIQQLKSQTVETKTLTSPIAQIDRIHTNVISPIQPGGDVTVAGNFVIQNASGSAVAVIDAYGNARLAGDLEARQATFSGELTARQARLDELTARQASISGKLDVNGVLRARKIIANEVEGVTQNITNITNVYQNTQESGIASDSAIQSGWENLIASQSAESSPVKNSGFIDLPDTIEHVTITQGLMSLGSTSLADTSVSGQFSVGGGLILMGNQINVLGADLELQPLRQGGISFLSGLVRIDSDGNLNVARDLSVRGKLSTNVITPLPNQDLIIQNASGSAVLSINQLGDIIASGTARLAGDLEARQATLKKLNLDFIEEAQAVSDTEVIASSSAGVATISAKLSFITIINPLVTEKSLIYITPRGTTNNQTLFLQRQVPFESFTVGTQQNASKDIPFNWLIIN